MSLKIRFPLKMNNDSVVSITDSPLPLEILVNRFINSFKNKYYKSSLIKRKLIEDDDDDKCHFTYETRWGENRKSYFKRKTMSDWDIEFLSRTKKEIMKEMKSYCSVISEYEEACRDDDDEARYYLGDGSEDTYEVFHMLPYPYQLFSMEVDLEFVIGGEIAHNQTYYDYLGRNQFLKDNDTVLFRFYSPHFRNQRKSYNELLISENYMPRYLAVDRLVGPRKLAIRLVEKVISKHMFRRRVKEILPILVHNMKQTRVNWELIYKPTTKVFPRESGVLAGIAYGFPGGTEYLNVRNFFENLEL